MHLQELEVQDSGSCQYEPDNHLLDAALDYSRRGWAVFPLHTSHNGHCSCKKPNCENAGKHPRFHEEDMRNGLSSATTDELMIRRWWGRWPDANIGIATGKISGFLVIDVDVKPGVDGNDAIRDLEELNGELPDTVESITGSGGRHILFAHPGIEVKNRTGVMPGIDVRGDGGYIVAPPSMHKTGNQYEWEASSNPDDKPLAEIPPWLLEIISEKGPARTTNSKLSDEEVIPRGRRNSTLASIAGKMRCSGFGQDTIEAALLKENESRCNPPLFDQEVRKIAQSISRYEPTHNSGERPTPQKPPLKEFNLTDLGNAERFAAQCGDNVHYCKESGTWYVFSGARWEEDRKGLVTQYAKQTIRDIYKQASLIEDDTKRTALVKHAASSESLSRINAMVTLAASEPGIPTELASFDVDLLSFCCANGTMDLKSGELKPHSRADLIRKISPVKFDPNANCPRWKAFLGEIMEGNSQLIAFLQKAVGYCLTGEVSEQVVFFLYGTGANGKTTFIEVIRSLLGDYAQQASMSTFLTKKQDGIPSDLAKLKGARFVSASEIENGRRLSEVTTKLLSGEDMITARFLHKEFFEFMPTHKVFIATNYKPFITGTDEGIWRRIRLIPFSVRIPEDRRDRNLIKKLKEELSGILTWAVQGCLDWRTNGLGFPTEVRKATAEYRDEMDVLSSFLEEWCIIEEGSRTDPAALYQKYKGHCEQFGEYQMNQRMFSQKLMEKGFVKKRSGGNGGYQWHGIRLYQ